jgi:hypothetical protein
MSSLRSSPFSCVLAVPGGRFVAAPAGGAGATLRGSRA